MKAWLALIWVTALAGAAALAMVGPRRSGARAPSASAPALKTSSDPRFAPLAKPPPVTLLAKPKFAWPVPGAVEVVERSVRDGNDALLSYSIEICPRADGHFVVSHRALKIDRLNGRSANEPEVAGVITQLEPLLSAIPIFVVDAAGTLSEVEGVDVMLQRLQATLPRSGVDKLAALLKDSDARATFSAALGERWQAWVGLWVQLDPQKGATQTVTDLLPGAAQATVNSEVSVDRVFSANRLAVSRRTVLDEQRSSAAIAPLFKALGTQGLNEYRISGTFSVEADLVWPSLRPNTVRTRKVVTSAHDGKEESLVESHDYVFGSWGTAPSCAKL